MIAIVLAGGAARRFGADKLAAELDGAPVLHHALLAVAGIADAVVLVLAPGAPEPPLPESMAGGVMIARDHAGGLGPLAGLAAGLAAGLEADPAAGRDHPARIAVVVGGDMPSLRPDVLRRMADRLDADDGLAAITLDATPPAPLPMAVRPAAVDPVVRELLAAGRRSLRSLLDAVPVARLPAGQWRTIDPDGETLRDIDTPDDLVR